MADDAQVIMNSIRRIVQTLRRSSVRTEKTASVTGAQALALRLVGTHAGVSINDLADLTYTHQSTVSEVVGRLEVLGFLCRRRASDDARRVELQLTESGRDLTATLEPTVQEDLMRALTRLPQETRAALAHGLGAWLTEAGLHTGPVVMFFEPDQNEDDQQ